MNRLTWYGWIAALFLVHNLEEVATLPGFLAQVETLAPPYIAERHISFPSHGQFFLAVSLITGIAWLALLGLSRMRNQRLADLLAASIQAAVGLNGLWHLGMVLLFGSYVPGAITGVLVNLPFTVLACRSLLTPHRLTINYWATVVGLAACWHGPLLWSVVGLSRALVA